MTWALGLEYLRVLLSAPVLGTFVFIWFASRYREDIHEILHRLRRLKVPGGELETQPQEPAPPPSVPPELKTLAGDSDELRAEKLKATLWEFNYLNLFFARSTQMVLDWLANLKTPATVALYHAFWSPIINEEQRQTILTVLDSHELVRVDANGLISITQKARDYLEFRGPLPPIGVSASAAGTSHATVS